MSLLGVSLSNGFSLGLIISAVMIFFVYGLRIPNEEARLVDISVILPRLHASGRSGSFLRPLDVGRRDIVVVADSLPGEAQAPEPPSIAFFAQVREDPTLEIAALEPRPSMRSSSSVRRMHGLSLLAAGAEARRAADLNIAQNHSST